MNYKTVTQLTKVAAVAVVAWGATSCASMMGNRNCRCTHPGPCVCCETGIAVAPGMSSVHQAQRDTAADDSLLSALLDLSKYELKSYLPEAPTRIVWQDAPVTDDMEQLLGNIKHGDLGVMPRGVTTDNTENAIYLYFKEGPDGKPEPLRLRIQYYADDPLNYYEAQFNINGFDYSFKPTNFKRGKGKGRMIWENSDDPVTAADKDLIYALAHGDWVVLKLMAPSGINHNKQLTDEQLAAFRQVLNLYLLKGGVIE
ncbi:MAG: hypothetical protein IKR25_11235 [Muribaculaceae bacterium]|nr:hypothetical protein [Muribaculaceae bacterium]